MSDAVDKHSPVEKLLGSPVWRHVAMLVIVSAAFGAMQTQLAYTQDKQSEISAQQDKDREELARQQQEFVKAMSGLKDVLTVIRIDGAITQQQVKALEDQMNGMNRKLDTMLWRTSPQNPENRDIR